MTFEIYQNWIANTSLRFQQPYKREHQTFMTEVWWWILGWLRPISLKPISSNTVAWQSLRKTNWQTADDITNYLPDKVPTISNQISSTLTNCQPPPTHVPLFSSFFSLVDKQGLQSSLYQPFYNLPLSPNPLLPTTADLINTAAFSDSHNQHYYWQFTHYI